jgi:hypothetical protein
MGKQSTTIIINTCDRCGSEHNEADYMKGCQWGQLNLTWHGDTGGRSWSGDAGGVNIKGKAWLCLPCTELFLKFIKGEK